MSTTPTIFTYTNGTTSSSNDTTISASSYSIPSGFDLSSVELGEGVLTLAANTFYNVPGAQALRSITFCSTITTLGQNCLHKTNIGPIVIPDQVTTLGNAFAAECPFMTSITLPAGATEVPDYAFYLSTGLTSVIFPTDASSQYTRIGVRAFSACSALPSFTMPNTITIIDEYAFNQCTSLASITFSSILTTINRWAFVYCSALNNITFPTTLTTLGNDIFNSCTSISSIYIPDLFPALPVGLFSNCTGLVSIRLPAASIRNAHTTIPSYFCSNCTSLTTIIFPSPSPYTNIDGIAFEGCTSLITLTLPEGLIIIGNDAFKGCTNLISISFPNTLKTIQYNCFEGCNKLPSVILPNSITNNGADSSLESAVFINCTALASITLPTNLISIPQNFCYGCSQLETIIWPTIPKLKTIGFQAFRLCKLSNLELPDGITTIGNNAFDGCILNTLKLPQTLTAINTGTFANNSGLKIFNIPASVTSVLYSFCYNTPAVTSVNFESHTSITSFDTQDLFFNSNQKVEVRFLTAGGYGDLTPALKGFVNTLGSRSNFTFKYGPPCFLKGTLIQCKKDDHECWRPVESLKKGDLVKTLAHGFLPIDVIGTKMISNPADDARTDVRLYKYSKEKVADLFEDLIITGTHSVLVPELSEFEREESLRVLGDIYVTDGLYRLPACVDQRSEPWAKGGEFEIYHFALENDNYYSNYGVFANGLLVESSSKRYIKEISGMKLLE